MNFEIGVGPAMVTAFLAVLLLLFTVIKFFADSEFRTWAAWVGLILAIIIVAGAWANMKLTGESFGDLQKLGGGAGGGVEQDDHEPAALDTHADATAAAAPTRRQPVALLSVAGPLSLAGERGSAIALNKQR